jgi:dTDP-4-dehydrorhamnose 3,5-epimerase
MKLVATPLKGLYLVETPQHVDERGWFSESFHAQKWATAFAEHGLSAPGPFVQDNHSCSRRGVVRGLHFQLPPHAQGKLVRVVRGAAFDVAVDVRRGSATFGQWYGLDLDPDTGRQLWIPAGFAHGFMALQDDTHFLYKTTQAYAPASERAIRWDDPAIGIRWPSLAPSVGTKDRSAPVLAQAEVFEEEER